MSNPYDQFDDKSTDLTSYAREYAASRGMDPDRAEAMMIAESGGRADRVSHKGAIGPMQLMPDTAKELGVDPHDPQANIRGGVDYWLRQKRDFGDDDLAHAAYNAGPGRVKQAGGVPNIKETKDYLQKINAHLSKKGGTESTNPYDQFDTKGAKDTGNPYDQFDSSEGTGQTLRGKSAANLARAIATGADLRVSPDAPLGANGKEIYENFPEVFGEQFHELRQGIREGESDLPSFTAGAIYAAASAIPYGAVTGLQKGIALGKIKVADLAGNKLSDAEKATMMKDNSWQEALDGWIMNNVLPEGKDNAKFAQGQQAVGLALPFGPAIEAMSLSYGLPVGTVLEVALGLLPVAGLAAAGLSKGKAAKIKEDVHSAVADSVKKGSQPTPGDQMGPFRPGDFGPEQPPPAGPEMGPHRPGDFGPETPKDWTQPNFGEPGELPMEHPIQATAIPEPKIQEMAQTAANAEASKRQPDLFGPEPAWQGREVKSPVLKAKDQLPLDMEMPGMDVDPAYYQRAQEARTGPDMLTEQTAAPRPAAEAIAMAEQKAKLDAGRSSRIKMELDFPAKKGWQIEEDFSKPLESKLAAEEFPSERGGPNRGEFNDITRVMVDMVAKLFGSDLSKVPKTLNDMGDGRLELVRKEIEKIELDSQHPFDAARGEIYNAIIGEQIRRHKDYIDNVKKGYIEKSPDYKYKEGDRLRVGDDVWRVDKRSAEWMEGRGKPLGGYLMTKMGEQGDTRFISMKEIERAGAQKLGGPTGTVSFGGTYSFKPPTAEQWTHLWKLMVGDTQMSQEDFTAKNKIPLGLDGKPHLVDMDSTFGISTASNRSRNALLNAIGTPKQLAYTIAKWFDNKIFESVSTLHNMNIAGKAVWDAYNKHYGMSSFTGTVNWRQFKKDIKLRLDAEKNTAAWYKEGGPMYPTKEQYMKMGMEEKAADVWVGVDKELDKMYHVASEAAKINGKTIAPQIPGYLPHVWRGPWRVQGYILRSDGSKSHLFELNSHTRAGRDAMQKVVEETIKRNGGQSKITVEPIDPKSAMSGPAEMMEGMWEMHERMKNSKGLEALLKMVYEDANKGMITHILDRSNPMKTGHLLERAAEYKDHPDLSLTREQMKEAIKSVQRATQAANEYYVKAKFCHDVLFPMDAKGYLSATNLRKTVRDRIDAFFGVSAIMEANFMGKIRSLLINQGLDPTLATRFSQGLQGTFSKIYLTFNVPFYAANALQSSLGFPLLMQAAARDQLLLGKSGSQTKALSNWSKQGWDIMTGNRDNKIIDYAIREGHADPNFMDLADPTRWRDQLANGIERKTRLSSFVLGYEYYRQLMPHDKALYAAGKFADDVAVPYRKSFGAPTRFGQLDIMEKPLTMFSTFTLHQLGVMNEQIQMARLGAKAGNYKAAAMAAGAAASFQFTNIALFGLMGGAMMANLDNLLRLYNLVTDKPVPLVKDWAREIDNVLPEGFRGTASYGLPSKVAGYDISTSGMGANFELPMAAIHMGGLFYNASVLSAKELLHGSTTRKEWWNDVGKSTPGAAKGFMEYAIKSQTFGDVIDYARGATPDYTVENDIMLKRGIERSKAAALVNFYTGLKTLEEKEFKQSEATTLYQEKLYEQKWDEVAQALKESNGQWDNRVYERVWDLAAQTNRNPADLIKGYMNSQISKQMTPYQRNMMQNLKPEQGAAGIQKYRRYVEQREREIERGAAQ